jgi:hypothetical protein
MNTDQMADLLRLEQDVTTTDDAGVRARWHSGRYMLTMRGGKKQLPRGMRAELALALKVAKTELTDRMKLAERCQTEEQLSEVIGQYRTWYAITHQYLPDKSRATARKSAAVRMAERLESFDYDALNDEEDGLMRKALTIALKRMNARRPRRVGLTPNADDSKAVA